MIMRQIGSFHNKLTPLVDAGVVAELVVVVLLLVELSMVVGVGVVAVAMSVAMNSESEGDAGGGVGTAGTACVGVVAVIGNVVNVGGGQIAEKRRLVNGRSKKCDTTGKLERV